jgi:hypothetical protein
MSFDPDKYLQQTAPATADFDPDAYLRQSVATLPQEETVVKEPQQEELVGEVTQNELDAITKKHRLNPNQEKELKNNLAFFGTKLQGTEQSALDQAPGFISDAVGLGLPQKYVIETADTEEMKNALDDLRQLAESRKSGLRTVAEIGAGFLLPGGGAIQAAKLGARAAKAAKVGALVGTPAVEMGARARRGEEAKGAAIGATLGGVLGIAAPKLIKAASAAKSKRLQEAVERQLSEMPDIEEVINTKMSANKLKYDIERKALAGEQLSIEEMKTWIGPEVLHKLPSKSAADIQEVAEAKLIGKLEDFEKFSKKGIEEIEREGEEFMLRQYDRFLKNKLADEAIAETGLRGKILPITGLKALALKFSDNKPLAKIMDARLGTNIERTLDDMSKKHNLYTVALGNSLEDLAKLRTLARKAKIEEEDVYRALDTGELGNVPEEVYSAWKKFFEDQRQTAIELGMPIKKITNYVPKRRLSTIKYIAAISRKAADIADKTGYRLGQLDPGEFTILKKDPEFRPLLNEVSFTANIPIDAADIFNREFNKIIHNPGHTRSALAMDAFATKAREGEIPDFVLDKQVGNLASKWLQSTFRSASLRDGIEELKRAGKIAHKAGDDFTAKHLEALTQDIIGSRGDTIARAAAEFGNKLVLGAQIKADKATNKFSKMMYEGVADAPLMVNTIMRQIYPNYLGMNPKSILQNLASPAAFIVPDMGTGYGSVKYLQSMMDLAATKAHGHKIKLSPEMARRMGKSPGEEITTKSLDVIMQNEGLLPQQWTGEMLDALQEGLKSGAVRELSRKALDRYTKGMMYLFEKSEIMARSNAYFMGKRIGKDMISDPEWASGFLSKIDSPSYQKALRKAIAAKDVESAQRLMSDFINSNNMFNYDRINMSAFGRYFGPMFSVFSKWPTSIAGRVLSDVERRGKVKGLVRNARTLMAPFAALAVVDRLTQPDDSDLYNRLVGQKGLKGWTPADSLFPIFEEGIFRTPAGQTFETIVQAATRDNKKMNTAVQDALNTYMPGSGLLRFLGEDLPVYRGRAKPAGPKIERRLKEIERYLK